MIPAYADFLSPGLAAALLSATEPTAVPGLRSGRGLQARFPQLESAEVLGLVVEVFRAVGPQLAGVLHQRTLDRAFLDERCTALAAANLGLDFSDPRWSTPIGERDSAGRVVLGPSASGLVPPLTTIPPFLRGHQVTLFGPPDSARMAINAMNAVHRRRPDEPAIVDALVGDSVARWGADSEDSKTPRLQSLYEATENLQGCFEGTIEVSGAGGKHYALAPERRSLPIKRVAGLALPDGNHFLEGAPLPLHLLELVQHAWLHRARPEALVYYFPKLENEEEAAYLAALLRETEAAIARRHAGFPAGSLRVLVVFENPRAIFRIREMAAALHPWFLGGSLGWHDFLASTARVFRNDPGYRIPVKADPNIVIRNIRESHRILVRDLGPGGAMKIGGMYGILPIEGDAQSYSVTMVGFVRDVATQLKRGLDGFWVAHPDFVRLGIALCEAWRRRQANPDDPSLRTLVSDLVDDPDELERLLPFVFGPDVEGLEPGHPTYLRAVLAADRGVSPLLANDHPDEVRYNVFQALQYLADWLSGNGCVALPASLRSARGEAVAVRVMDDLATTERSRWELWAEVAHGRVSREAFEAILHEEVEFLQAGRSEPGHRPQVRWEGEAARWYPIAVRVLRQLVLSPTPPEFVTELVLPFSFDLVRDDPDPWARACALCPGRFEGGAEWNR